MARASVRQWMLIVAATCVAAGPAAAQGTHPLYEPTVEEVGDLDGGAPGFSDRLARAVHWDQDRFGNPLTTRTTLERPSHDRRILSVHGRTAKDTEALLLHVTYTRRK